MRSLILILVLMFSGVVQAETYENDFVAIVKTGKGLKAACGTAFEGDLLAGDKVKFFMCASYINGMSRGVQIGTGSNAKPLFCVPSDQTILAVIAAYYDNVEDKYLEHDPSVGLTIALRKAYPCKVKK